jgi:hypothetical protein
MAITGHVARSAIELREAQVHSAREAAAWACLHLDLMEMLSCARVLQSVVDDVVAHGLPAQR